MPTPGTATLAEAAARLEPIAEPPPGGQPAGGQPAGGQPAGGQPAGGQAGEVPAGVTIDGVTLLEGLVELSTAQAAALLPRELDVSIPGSLRVGVWSWRPRGDDQPASLLGELRLGCQRGLVRYSFPLVSVFCGDDTARAMLRSVGIPAERGEVALRVFHDVAQARITSPRTGEITLKLALRDAVDPHGLQWNFAPLLQPYPRPCTTTTGVASSGDVRDGRDRRGGTDDGPTLGLVRVRHRFDALKRGQRIELALDGPLTPYFAGNLGPTVGAFTAEGTISLEPPIGLPGLD